MTYDKWKSTNPADEELGSAEQPSRAKYKVGDRVLSNHSGKPWIIKEVVLLDKCGTYGYRVRRIHGTTEYGPTRMYGEFTFYLSDYQDNDRDMAAKQAFIGNVFVGTD